MAVKLEGADMLLRDIENMIPTDLDVSEALGAGAEVIKKEMVVRAPVGETGKLKKAINVGKVRNSKRGKTITVGIHRRDIDLAAKKGAYYPAFVEHGHEGPKKGSPRTPAHPFIRPSYDLKKDDAWAVIKQTTLDQWTKKGL